MINVSMCPFMISLDRHISHSCSCKFNGRKCSVNQKRNNNKSYLNVKAQSNIIYAEEIMF